MRKSRFTESQIVGILKQGEAGVPIAEILRQHKPMRRSKAVPSVPSPRDPGGRHAAGPADPQPGTRDSVKQERKVEKKKAAA